MKVGQDTAYAKEVGGRWKKDVLQGYMVPAMKLVRVNRYNSAK